MDQLDIIAKKRDGFALTQDEIDHMILGYANNQIPDYQMSAFLMAVYLRGLDSNELSNFTRTMVNSGDKIDLNGINGVKVDKHSTGGVGDKVTLILGPMMAAAGLKVAKMSGRGLGHTGGTLDKLESIDGFKTNLESKQFIKQVNDIGIAILGQTKDICPADKKMYSLRDVTATVSSIPLIASSIMCKKIAGGADVIVLDVKVGTGAFMKTVEDAEQLARLMISIGQDFGKRVTAVLTNMDQPLGYAIGNALEVKEAIAALKGYGAPDLMEVCNTLGAELLVRSELADTTEEALEVLSGIIQSQKALRVFEQFVIRQGGAAGIVSEPQKHLPWAKYEQEVESVSDGYVAGINALEIGKLARYLGAGRTSLADNIDHSVGIVLHKKVGDQVRAREPLARIYANDVDKLEEVCRLMAQTFSISNQPLIRPATIYDIIE